MSAISIVSKAGSNFYTKDYDTVEEVKAAMARGEPLTVFWFTVWGKRYTETLLMDWENVDRLLTEREIP